MTMQSPDPVSPVAIGETIVGSALAGAPLWMKFLVEFNLIIASITGMCGLIIALVGVYRIINRQPSGNYP